ncbi:UNVERIFIED_CONTAM: hypothetical protein NY603_39410, partial [Bacteroidetes bacterium 56_B9]
EHPDLPLRARCERAAVAIGEARGAAATDARRAADPVGDDVEADQRIIAVAGGEGGSAARAIAPRTTDAAAGTAIGACA